MTYLNIMNNVLRRLREEEVNSVNDSTFSKMAGDFINDAKTVVEQAADWSALRDTLVISTVADDNLYSLTGCGDDVKVMSSINDTQNCFMEYQTKDWFNDKIYISNEVSGAPKYYTYNGLDSSGDTQILVNPKPDGVYSLRFDVIKRQAELTSNADSLLIPEKPVIHLVIAYRKYLTVTGVVSKLSDSPNRSSPKNSLVCCNNFVAFTCGNTSTFVDDCIVSNLSKRRILSNRRVFGVDTFERRCYKINAL